jgi:hypothetical protein
MTQKRRTIGREFKPKVVIAVARGDKTTAQLAGDIIGQRRKIE